MLRTTLPLLLILTGCRNDKDAVVDTAGVAVAEVDADGDGYLEDEDCDDADGDANPGAAELCDGVDNNCDGAIDEGVQTTYYADSDGDGFGDEGSPTAACDQPEGYVGIGNDCDDTDGDSYPGAAERCDGADNDCDGTVDEEVVTEWHADADGDGHGDPDSVIADCDPPDGYTDDDSDCDDLDATAHPGAEEVCDGADNDCDDAVDEDVTATFYQDADSDGYGVADVTTEDCDLPTGYAARAGDCDDTDGTVSPNATEVCDGADNDCDGDTDEDDASDAATWHADDDSDGYGDAADSTVACAQPSGHVADDSDCDDADADANPGEAEVCDSIDNDCDGETDEDSATDAATWYADSDGDGYGSASSTVACTQPAGFADNSDDCNDATADANPGEAEVCDEIDNDCDGDTDEGVTSTYYLDYDSDGYGDAARATAACAAPSGYTTDDTDCDDTNADANPGESEVCDEADNDCDGSTDEGVTSTYYADGDGDGQGDPDDTTAACSAPSGYTTDSSDCDDTDAGISTNAAEVCDEVDNDCDGDTDEDDAADAATWYADDDGDGYGVDSDTAVGCGAPSGYAAEGGDCDDTDADYSPGAAEGCDGEDYNCDGDVDSDADGDGYADADCGGEDCDDSDAALVFCGSCEDWYDSGASTDGVYEIDPGSTGAYYDVYCNMTDDGGGWTLAFTATADSTTYGSGWDYWWTAGGTTSLTSTTGTGKSDAYDEVTFSEIRLTASSGSSSIYADTGSTYTGLPSLVGAEITTCSGLQGTPRHRFTSTSRSGSYWQNNYIALVACDTDGTDLESSGGHYDAAIFTTNLSHGDYNYADGDLGSEFRLGGYNGSSTASSSNRLSVWLR